MPVAFGDLITHSNNGTFALVDITEVRGAIRGVTAFDNTNLAAEFANIPDKVKVNYSVIVDRSTGQVYYLSSGNGTDTSHWSLILAGPSGPVGTLGDRKSVV
jgi:hypothetical protein